MQNMINRNLHGILWAIFATFNNCHQKSKLCKRNGRLTSLTPDDEELEN